MKQLLVTREAMLFCRASCKQQDNYIKAQQDRGIDPPKINLELNFIRDYYRNNDLAQRDMDLIVEELIEAGVLKDNS
jgi:hypothetical protein